MTLALGWERTAAEARRGLLTVDKARKVLNEMLSLTGQAIDHESAEDFATRWLAGKQKLTVRLRDITNSKLKVLHYNRPSPGEYRLGQSIPAALAAAPEFTAATVRENITPVETRQSIEPWCYFMALACALGSVVLRRV